VASTFVMCSRSSEVESDPESIAGILEAANERWVKEVGVGQERDSKTTVFVRQAVQIQSQGYDQGLLADSSLLKIKVIIMFVSNQGGRFRHQGQMPGSGRPFGDLRINKDVPPKSRSGQEARRAGGISISLRRSAIQPTILEGLACISHCSSACNTGNCMHIQGMKHFYPPMLGFCSASETTGRLTPIRSATSHL
jgi:hypothetical protein